MSDGFEPVRKAILAAQEALKAEEAAYRETMSIADERCRKGEMNTTELSYWRSTLMQHVRAVEWRICELKQMMPPYTVQRDGYLEKLPVWEPIDPRTPPIPAYTHELAQPLPS